MSSVVIAAHNEENVLDACLRSLLQQGVTAGDIVVVANGCVDRTADVARQHGVVVVELAQAGKARALNAGDEAAKTFPRIYLDADIVVPPGGVNTVTAGLSANMLVGVPQRRVETSGRPWPVRAYFTINERLPAFREGLFGRGMIVLSEEGRKRFDRFPELIADDLFLDSLFVGSEKVIVDDAVVVVEAPHTAKDLFRRLVRVRRGNREMRAAGVSLGSDVRPSDPWAWLRESAPRPALWPAAVCYAAFTIAATVAARRAGGDAWGRDESTRQQQDPARGKKTS